MLGTPMEDLVRAAEATSFHGLLHQMRRAAARYAGLRAEWALASVEARPGLEDTRSFAHDAFIDACNILSRNMAARGESIEWRRELGDDRKTLGDFACWLTLSLALSAR